jgi:tRNA 2-thiouridine synthesizing protein A
MTEYVSLREQDGGTPVEVLDCTGLLCPLPVYLASRALARLGQGQSLRVVCTDPGALADFPALAAQGGHQLVSAHEEDGTQTFVLRKGGAR